MSNWFSRQRRIIGRVINKKTLPQYTYRWDERTPEQIRSTGFMPWDEHGMVTLIEHVKGTYGPNHATKPGGLVKYDSQFVSTGAYGFVKKLDPTFAH